MIPLRDENPTRRLTWVTWALVTVNVALFFYELSLGTGLEPFVVRYAMVPSRFLAAPFSPAQWLTVFSSMFLHAGWLHIGGNMLYLWIFGNNVEDRLGHLGFVGFYLLSGMAAALTQLAVSSESALPVLGASGAIAGVLGAYIVLFPGARVLTLIPIFFFVEISRLPAYLVIGFWFLLQLAVGVGSLTSSAAQQGGVAYFAHIGGFAAGLLIALPVALSGRRTRGY